MKNKNITIILALCCFILAAAPAAAETANKAKKKYLPGAFILLPEKTKLKFEWALAPVENKQAESAGDINARFSVDGVGNPWLSRDNDMLADMAGGFVLRTATQFKGFTFLDSGMIYLTDGKYLDFMAEPDKKSAVKGVIIDVRLQPLAALPAPECAIFPGEGNILYLTGHDGHSGTDSVYTFGGKGSVVKTGGKGSALCYREIFSAKKPITAVAGDGNKTYIAMGRMVVELTQGPDAVKGFFVHPSEDITGLAYSAKAGLFYSTASCVGYAGANGCIDFIRLAQPAILMRKNSLYVFVPGDFGVLKISNAEDMKTSNFKSKESAAR
jgi:hypothetical protein